MGQPITVLAKPSNRFGILRFEINRSLTSMAGERYADGDEIDGVRPCDELARRLLAVDGVRGVHISSNVITVEVQQDGLADQLQSVIEELFIYYRDGVTPDPVDTAVSAD